MENIIGKVIKILDDYRIVINKGSVDGVTIDNRFLIYNLGDELYDEDTKESLGKLEYVCGEGKPEHIQEKMTTIVSNKYENKVLKKIKKSNSISFFGESIEETYDPEKQLLPFNNVDIGTLVKQIL